MNNTKAIRGGAWYSNARHCRSADRNRYRPGNRYDSLGFRIIKKSDQSYRIIRGGSWGYEADYCRSAYRYRVEPSNRGNNLGFRVIKQKKQERKA